MTGRNEPCPCGSGLKFKKCCEAIEQSVRIDANVVFKAERQNPGYFARADAWLEEEIRRRSEVPGAAR